MNKLTHLVVSLGLATVATASSAASVHIVFDNPIFMGSGYDNVNITFANPAASGSITEYVSAGRFQGTGSNLQGVTEGIFVDQLSDLYMYCYDIYQNINHGQSLTYTVNFDGELDRTRSFLGAVNAVMNAGRAAADYDPYAWLHPVDGYQGAAIQIGIWESKYDTAADWNLDSGSFKASLLETSTTTHWNSFRNAIGSSPALDPALVMTLDNPSYQDMITGDPPVNVPEPGSLALLGAALAGLACVQGRKARTRANLPQP